MLVRLTQLLKNLMVYPERMLENLNRTGGLVYSQRVLLALVDRGVERKAAYEAVQRNAMEAWERRESFHALVSEDPLISKKLTQTEIEACFDPEWYVRHLNEIYRRVFGAKAVPPKTGRTRKGRTRP